ncbi:putative adsorption associated tail protein [Rhizobium phage RHph_I1_18]|nr:putative adsorption associated tail protein [Rhizobium phage RHph_I1_18]
MPTDILQTNLSVAPYFDDIDEAKQFVRILFVPARAVQTRELNQIQSLQQLQVSRFADHIFKDGAVVKGVAVTYIPSQSFVYVANVTDSNSTIVNLDDSYVLTSNTGVRAVPRKVISGFVSQYPKAQRIYLDYIKTGKDVANNDVHTFQSGETITIYENQSKLGTLDANNVTDTISVLTQNSTVTSIGGNAYAITTSDGVIYQKGHFLNVDSQYTIVNEYSQNVTNMTVGFTTVESLVTEDSDSSLNDNAAGEENENAPGAHRLKLTPSLIAVDKTTLGANTTFYPIVEFDGNTAVEDNTQNEVYNILGDVIAQGISEESGDYVIKPFSVESLTSSNNSTMRYAVSPGTARVKGHRVNFIGTKYVEVPRAVTTISSNAQIVTANYGSYVLVDEIAGLFSGDTLDTVTIYDTAQNTLSDVEGAGSAPSGSAVGTATVRAFVHNNGTKGKPSCQYRLYISNIKMNSGKSFLNDAKSFYVDGTYGKAKADIVLENSKAVITDSANDKLFFPFGIGPIKRLTDENGTNDSQFVIRDAVTATLQANGFVTFTTNAPYAGGVERINNGVGVLSDTAELAYDICLSTEAYSNLTGTVSSTGTTVTGTGTSFTTNFVAGDFIRIGTDVREVTAVANTTQLTINASLSATANVYAKYYPQGHIVDLAGAGSLEVLSNSQFSVQTNLGTLSNGPQTVRALFPVLRSTAVPARKIINKDTFVKLDLSTAGTGGEYDLGLVDVTSLNAVYFGTTFSETNPDRSSWFTLDNGQTSTEYGHAKLIVKPDYKSKLTSSIRLLVKLDHFSANTSAGGGFFSVDSYPLIRENDTANTTNIAIADVYNIGSYDFRDVVDFRPYRYNTANTAATANVATTNPAAANTSYQLTSSGAMLIAPDENFQADIESYLPRYDLITLSKNGDIVVRSGEPAANPKIPFNESDTMSVASVFVPAYPTLTTREFEDNKRSDLGTRFNILTNRRYTMEDIGTIDKRVTRLEYYTVLNALEQSARDMTVLDENGLDRFKNGIFADSFNSHLIGRTDYQEYKIAIDKDAAIARPRFNRHSIDQMFMSSTSTNIQRTGNHLSLPYTSDKFIEQAHASKFRNCTESVWKWKGSVSLYPSYDSNRDETKLPAVNATVDLASAWEDFAESPFGSEYGDWRTTNVSQSSSSSSSSSTRTSGTRQTTSTTTTTTTTTKTTQQRILEQLKVNTNTNVQNLGSYVTDVSMNPYIASRVVAFVGTGFKPNTRMYMFFDDVAVSQHCAPGVLSGITTAAEGHENEVVTRTGDFGSTITSDSAGNVVGVFRIPEGTFRTGDRVFLITNVDDLITGADAQLSKGDARYTASSISVSTQGISLTTIEPQLQVNNTVESRTSTSSTTSSSTTSQVTNIAVRNRLSENRGGNLGDAGRGDPIAQSIFVSMPDTSVSTGMIVDKIGVFFRSKDPTLGVTVSLMEMTSGLPDSSRILATKHLEASEVSVSNDGSAETIFDFDNLAYLARDKFYAFMVRPDGDSPEYTIWVAEVGGTDIDTGRQIFTNPYIGVMFVSANMNTWTAIQTEEIKFNVYRAKFTALTGTAKFVNEDDDFFTVDGFNKANSSVAIQTGDVVYRAIAGVAQTSNVSPFGIVQSVDEVNDQLIVDSSTGLYAAGHTIQIHRPFMNGQNTISSNTLIATANIVSIDNQYYSAVVPRFATSIPAYTDITMQFKGTDTAFTIDADFSSVVGETDTEFVDKDRIVVSRSNEVASMSGNKSALFNLNFKTQDDFMSPILDLRRKTSLFIENIINNDATNESTIYGNAVAKYVGPIVTLAEGQDAEDINFYVTAYRPTGTDVKVYVKLANATDASPFDGKVWTEMTCTEGANTYGSTSNPEDYREYKFELPSAAPVSQAAFKNASNNGVVEYVDGNGVRFIGYKQFSVKIVLLSDTKCRVPRLPDVRGLCLQI